MRRGFIEAQQDVFGAYIDLLGQRGEAAEALVVAERARARAFLDLRAERPGYAALDAGFHRRRPARRGAPALDDPRLLGRPVGAVDLGGAAGSRAGAGPRARSCRRASPRWYRRRRASTPAGTAARGLLMTDRAQHAPWRELDALLIAPVRTLLAGRAGQPAHDRAAWAAVRAVVRRTARRGRRHPPRSARSPLRAGDCRAGRAVAGVAAGRARRPPGRRSRAAPGRARRRGAAGAAVGAARSRGGPCRARPGHDAADRRRRQRSRPSAPGWRGAASSTSPPTAW